MSRDRSLPITVEENIRVRMRDGVELACDVYRPVGSARCPVLLTRTPYDKTIRNSVRNARALAERGYVAVVQDVRGRYQSEGNFDYITGNDEEDGYDTISWAANLSGTTGGVGVWGHSYPASMAWRAISCQPPALGGALASGMTVHRADANFGILDIGRRLQWWYEQAADARRRAGDIFGPHMPDPANDLWQNMERGKWLWHVPLGSIPDDVFSTLTTPLKESLATQHVDNYAFDQIHPKVAIPTCTVTGWWDRFVNATDHYLGVLRHGAPEIRDRHRLVVGPWTHHLSSAEARRADLGPRGAYEPVEANSIVDLTANFFDPLLRGRETPDSGRRPVRLFILNHNEWVQTDSWPPSAARFVPYFLHSKGRANTPLGDGTLSEEPSGAESPDRFVYDPRDPAMFLGTPDVQPAPRDQAPLGRRQDILVYQTAPLEEDVLVVGPLECRIWAASDCVETDFTAKLVEVGPDGLAINLCTGICRTRFLDGYDKIKVLEPGTPYEIPIRLQSTGILFRRGSRIRLDISSSEFPNFDRNHNTGRDYLFDSELRPARQTIFHDGVRPSHIILPILPTSWLQSG